MVLVYNINKTVYVCFDKLVEYGDITILNDKNHLLHYSNISNSIYEKFNLNNYAGNITLKITCDAINVLKQLTIR